MKILIKNGRVINPADSMAKVVDLYIENGKVTEISENIKKPCDKVIDAHKMWVMPMFI